MFDRFPGVRPQAIGNEIPGLGRDEIHDVPTDQFGGGIAQHLGELGVGIDQATLLADGNPFERRFGQLAEPFFALLQGHRHSLALDAPAQRRQTVRQIVGQLGQELGFLSIERTGFRRVDVQRPQDGVFSAQGKRDRGGIAPPQRLHPPRGVMGIGQQIPGHDGSPGANRLAGRTLTVFFVSPSDADRLQITGFVTRLPDGADGSVFILLRHTHPGQPIGPYLYNEPTYLVEQGRFVGRLDQGLVAGAAQAQGAIARLQACFGLVAFADLLAQLRVGVQQLRVARRDLLLQRSRGLFQGLLYPLVLAHVANGSQRADAGRGGQGVQADLRREFAAIVAQTPQDGARIHRPLAGVAKIVGRVLTVQIPQACGNEPIQRHAGEHSGRIAEQAFSQGVGLSDLAGLIHHEHGVRRHLQQAVLDRNHSCFTSHRGRLPWGWRRFALELRMQIRFTAHASPQLLALRLSESFPLIDFGRFRFKDTETGKTLVFLTNHFALPAATVCGPYRSRLQAELFKSIKQHLRIKRFFGTSENAVRSQIWIAVSACAFVVFVKKRLQLDASLYPVSIPNP